MPRKKDIAGMRVNSLTVIGRTGSYSKNRCCIWLCKCDCGNFTNLPTSTLMKGVQKSCGCANKTKKTTIKHGHTRGGVGSKTYNSWGNMIQRCGNKLNHKYPIYGGRGIRVCEEWLSFESFLSDMGEKPQGMTLERVDVNGMYCGKNCIWASPKDQSNNKRNNTILTHNGTSMTVSRWADHVGISYAVIRMRLHRGWTVKRTLTQEVRRW